MNELMNGVQVLSERTVNINNNYGELVFLYGILMIVSIYFFAGLLVKNKYIPAIIFCIIAISCGIATFASIDMYNNSSYYKQYKVIINDNITYKEFTDKFDVISQEGKIYTVKLKESEE